MTKHSPPQRRVQLSVVSVLNTLTRSNDRATAWVGALRILSCAAASTTTTTSAAGGASAAAVMSSSQQQQQQPLSPMDHAKWVLPTALSLQCWCRSGREAAAFWSSAAASASGSCEVTSSSSASQFVTMSLEGWSHNQQLPAVLHCIRSLLQHSAHEDHQIPVADAKTTAAAAAAAAPTTVLDTIFFFEQQTDNSEVCARAAAAILQVAELHVLRSSATGGADLTTLSMLLSTVDRLLAGTRTATRPDPLMLAEIASRVLHHFSSQISAAASQMINNNKNENNNSSENCRESEVARSAANSAALQAQLRRRADYSQSDDANIIIRGDGERAVASRAAAGAAAALVENSSSGAVAAETSDESLQTIWNFASRTVLSLQQRAEQRSSAVAAAVDDARRVAHFCISSALDPMRLAFHIDRDLQHNHTASFRATVGNEELLVRAIDRYYDGEADDNSGGRRSRTKLDSNSSSSSILRMADRLFPHVARSPAVYASVLRALRHQGAWQAAIEFSKDAPAFVRGDLNPALVRHLMFAASANAASASFSSANPSTLLLRQNRTVSSGERKADEQQKHRAMVSDIVDVYAASIESEYAADGGRLGSLATSSSLAEVARAAIKARRWDAALTLLQRVLLREKLQLESTVVAEIINAAPAHEQRLASMLHLAEAVHSKVPFFRRMAMAALVQVGAESSRRSAALTHKDRMERKYGSELSASWMTALSQLRAMSIASGTQEKFAIAAAAAAASNKKNTTGVPVTEYQPQQQVSSSSAAPLPLLPFTPSVEFALMRVANLNMMRLLHAMLLQCDFTSRGQGQRIALGRPLLLAVYEQHRKQQASADGGSEWAAVVDLLIDGALGTSGVTLRAAAGPIAAHLFILRLGEQQQQHQQQLMQNRSNVLAALHGAASAASIISPQDTVWSGFAQLTRGISAAVRKRLTNRHEGNRFAAEVVECATMKGCDPRMGSALLLGLIQGALAVPASVGTLDFDVLARAAEKLRQLLAPAVATHERNKIDTTLLSSIGASSEFQEQFRSVVNALLEHVAKTTRQDDAQLDPTTITAIFAISRDLEHVVASVAADGSLVSLTALQTLRLAVSVQNSDADLSAIAADAQTLASSVERSEDIVVQLFNASVATALKRTMMMSAAERRSESCGGDEVRVPIVATWEKAARLLSAQWKAEGAPPQATLLQVLNAVNTSCSNNNSSSSGGSEQGFLSVPIAVVRSWEMLYRQRCPVPSPSLMAAFIKARKP